MRRHNKNNNLYSIKDLIDKANQDTYTIQTIQSLSRCILETLIDDRNKAVILIKIKDTNNFINLLNRLKYTDIKVYNYSENIEGFQKIELEKPQMENDEFFVVAAERFSACICWNESTSDVFELCEGFCSLNPGDSKKIIEHLQTVCYSENLEEDLQKVLQDRRNNEKYTTIIQKILSDLENRQRDLICANAELKELHEKSGESEKIASMSQLFSTAMHEIRNPLGSISLHTRIISKKLEQLDVENREILKEIFNSIEMINRTSEDLEKILSELLDFSKPLSLKKMELNLEETLNEIINLIKPSYENKNVELLTENILESNYSMFFDRANFHQIIFNLLKNALEVSEPGQKVKVLLENDSENTYIKISDEGPGVSEQNRKKIFEPYFTTKKEGTGLGLAQAKKILEAHEGDLYLAPKNTIGATFILSIPAVPLGVQSTAGKEY